MQTGERLDQDVKALVPLRLVQGADEEHDPPAREQAVQRAGHSNFRIEFRKIDPRRDYENLRFKILQIAGATHVEL